MFGGHEARKDDQAPRVDHVVVISPAEFDPAILHHTQTSALCAILRIELLEPDDAVGEALHLQVVIGRGHVVEQHDRALPLREVLLQCKNLSPVSERVSRQQTQLRKRVDHHAGRLEVLNVCENELNRRRQLDLRRVEHRVLLIRLEALFGRHELPNRDAVEIPSMRERDGPEFLLRL